jgi:nucleotide-binding universal stress UspA family protein
VSAEVSEEEAGAAIAHAATSVDLVILSTHGRGGFDRWRHGSVATQVVADLPTPILLVRMKPTGVPTPPIGLQDLALV